MTRPALFHYWPPKVKEDFSEVELNLIGAISYELWVGLDYHGVESPGYIATKLVEQLSRRGWKFTQPGGNQ